MPLFIVSTPIGNLQDITLRALTTLKSCDVIVCEDSRITGNLLHHFEIKKEMLVLNDVNEENKLFELVSLLDSGKNLALVSDAGTPLISDPGFKLVRACLKKNIKVIPIPGANSITTALSASGLPTDKFLFMGFLPDSKEKKKKVFLSIYESYSSNKLNPTIIFFESPHKLIRALDAFEEVFKNNELTVARELTKIYEEFLRGSAADLKKHFEKHPPKGEFVLLFRVS